MSHLTILYHRSSYVRFFSALNSIPQISAQDEAAVTSRDRPTVVVVMFFPVVYAVVSSANMEQLYVIDFGKSLIKIKNRRGPSTVPWGMPDIKHCVFELLPLTQTHCCLFVRKDENQRKVSPFPLSELRKTLGKSVDNWLDYACLCDHLCRWETRWRVPFIRDLPQADGPVEECCKRPNNTRAGFFQKLI